MLRTGLIPRILNDHVKKVTITKKIKSPSTKKQSRRIVTRGIVNENEKTSKKKW